MKRKEIDFDPMEEDVAGGVLYEQSNSCWSSAAGS
jgi:hypothetical protein